MFSASQYFRSFAQQLATIHDQDEARAITNYLTSEVLLIKYHQLALLDKELTEADVSYFDAVLKRLMAHEPLQYILGHTWFCGLKFEVNNHVLIPRPETEELVERVLEHCRSNSLREPRIIDLGTGSGCIAVALKKAIPGARVFATDISPGALETAAHNARINKAEVTFFHDDLLNARLENYSPFDLIVSNPPYIDEAEEQEMALHVKQYEPRMALFSPGDALAFYKAVAKIGRQHLAAGGSIWLEINPLLAEETRVLFGDNTRKAEVVHDLSGKKRFVVCTS